MKVPNKRILCVVKKLLIALLILLPSLLTGCIPIWRSAHGLRPGEVQAAYIPPIGASVGVGITKNIDSRLFAIGNQLGGELRYHQHGKFDRAISLGYSQLPTHVLKVHDGIQHQTVGITGTISKHLTNRLDPYLACSTFYSLEYQTEHVFKPEDISDDLDESWKFDYFIATGLEFCLFPREWRFNILLTPEIMFLPESLESEGADTWVNIGLGLSYDF
jgi:hypothetical protein